MKLRHAHASPYARKVRVLIREAGLLARVEEIETATTPVATPAVLWTENPSGRIPVLILDDGATLFDSRVITRYLDSLHGKPKFYPATAPEHWTVMRQEATAEGLLDSAVNTRYEMALRPEAPALGRLDPGADRQDQRRAGRDGARMPGLRRAGHDGPDRLRGGAGLSGFPLRGSGVAHGPPRADRLV